MRYKVTIMNNSKPKYLFLDIDGVLNSFDDYKLQGRSFLENINNISFVLGDKQIDLINEVIENYNPTIIISSYWRNRCSIKEMQEIFEDNGFLGSIEDFTSKDGKEHLERWKQIKEYIDNNNVLNYIILDDTQLDKNNTQYANWIQTDSYVGLTKDHIKLIDKIWR